MIFSSLASKLSALFQATLPSLMYLSSLLFGVGILRSVGSHFLEWGANTVFIVRFGIAVPLSCQPRKAPFRLSGSTLPSNSSVPAEWSLRLFGLDKDTLFLQKVPVISPHISPNTGVVVVIIFGQWKFGNGQPVRNSFPLSAPSFPCTHAWLFDKIKVRRGSGTAP